MRWREACSTRASSPIWTICSGTSSISSTAPAPRPIGNSTTMSNCSVDCSANRMEAKSARSSWNARRSEEHTSELQSLMRISYAVFCLKKKKEKSQDNKKTTKTYNNINVASSHDSKDSNHRE